MNETTQPSPDRPRGAATGLNGPAEGEAQGGTAAPDGTAASGGSLWRAAAKRTFAEFTDDQLTDRAAALTYYSVLAIFPGLLVVVSLLGLLGKSATKPLLTNFLTVAPSNVKQIIEPELTRLQGAHTSASFAAILGIVLAVWSASAYIAAFMRASNTIYDVPEGRPFWKKTPQRVGVTLLILVMLVASALIVVVSGGLARHVGQVLGIGSTAVTVWNIAKWPVLLIIVILMISILYWTAPNAKRQRGFQLISPGGVIAVVVWLIASALFAFYVANFSHYNKTYGSIAGVIIMLIWLWISNLAILFGAEFNAELERGRAAQAGEFPLGQEPYVELRDTRKLRKHNKWAEGTGAGQQQGAR
jgi:membrane protein